jgi:type IV secretory pathway TrbD component
MRDGLTSQRIEEAKGARGHTSQHNLWGIPRVMLFGFIAGALFLTAALWWHFGEGVFVTSMMSAIIACF